MSKGQLGRLMVVDDEKALMQAITDTLISQGYEVNGYTSANEALQALRAGEYDLVLSDLKMPEMDGITLLQKVRSIDPNLEGIIMTGQGSIDNAIEAMKIGALDFILKPFKINSILPILSRAISIKQLRTENTQLTEHLMKRTEDLEQSNKDLEAFSYSVSHDLRAPLHFIKNFSKIIEEDYQHTFDPQLNTLFSRITKYADKMETLIEDLLRFSASGRHALEKKNIETSTLVGRVIRELIPSPSKYQVEIENLPVIFADEGLMHQVFSNLLANAVKYSGKVEKPVIHIGSEQEEDKILFFVKDNGAGFDIEDAQDLFEAFYRQHSSEEFDGTGVGLAIVKRVISKHGGKVWAEGKKGKGATFYFDLPRSK